MFDSLRDWLPTILTILGAIVAVWARYKRIKQADASQALSERSQTQEDDGKKTSLYLQFKNEVDKLEQTYESRVNQMELRHLNLITEIETRHTARINEMEQKHNTKITEIETQSNKRVNDMESRHAIELSKVKAEMGLVLSAFSYLCEKVMGEHPDWVATANEIIAGRVKYPAS